MPDPDPIADGAQLIAAERARQMSAEGWTPEHDDEHDDGSLAMAAACYATPIPIRGQLPGPCGCRSVGECMHWLGGPLMWMDPWPWSSKWDKRAGPSAAGEARIRDLIKAGALIAAEIDRLQRACT